jgi:hypothetical protein
MNKLSQYWYYENLAYVFSYEKDISYLDIEIAKILCLSNFSKLIKGQFPRPK